MTWVRLLLTIYNTYRLHLHNLLKDYVFILPEARAASANRMHGAKGSTFYLYYHKKMDSCNSLLAKSLLAKLYTFRLQPIIRCAFNKIEIRKRSKDSIL